MNHKMKEITTRRKKPKTFVDGKETENRGKINVEYARWSKLGSDTEFFCGGMLGSPIEKIYNGVETMERRRRLEDRDEIQEGKEKKKRHSSQAILKPASWCSVEKLQAEDMAQHHAFHSSTIHTQNNSKSCTPLLPPFTLNPGLAKYGDSPNLT
ncbi:hypothetical protein M5K25_028150 [Dendrobium thyrsiflorum]|uniref:Uncharacterized protein n=1 Tax=Dendrobium thyrsiflorum TaxID=117978 RepID=A0ABD0TVT1_DENTH